MNDPYYFCMMFIVCKIRANSSDSDQLSFWNVPNNMTWMVRSRVEIHMGIRGLRVQRC